MSTEQDITHNIQAINPNLEKLKQAFPHCFDKNGAFDFAKFKAELDSNDINIAKEGYSLDWLGKSYARVLASDAATTLLKEDEVHNTKPGNANSQNVLIKGDNLEVLKHLSNAYYEKVKMIYIDPPYNTGSDGFVYNDDRKFTAKQLQDLAGVSEDEAKRILEFTQSNSNSHSAWLTFMYPRLYIAKQLLKDDGVIFVSIDDNEVAQLRLLLDEVFGEENFVAVLPWRKRSAKSDVPFGVSQDYEWILIYANNKFYAGNNIERKYYKTDDYPNDKWRLSDLTTQKVEADRPNSAFDLINPKDQKVYKYNPNRLWGITKDTFNDYYEKGKIVFPGDYNFLNISIPAYRVFESEDKAKSLKKYGSETPLKAISTLLPKECGMSEDGNKEIVNLFGKKIFSFPKPTSLLKFLINIINDKELIVLDFFAGSASTADSIMQLNAEDGGNRKYILVQLPEEIDVKKNKTAYDFVKDELGISPPTIFEITKERITRAVNQINAEIDSKLDKLKNELPTEENKAEIAKNLALKTQNSFKIFETTPIWEDYDFKAEKLANAEKLFDDEKLTEADVKALFTTWKTYDGSPLTEPVEEVDLAGYKAYYTKRKLYLMYKGFSTAALKALLEQIDADANFNPTAIIAFGYYFESKALREIAENIKTYNNKKNIDIDFITRY